MRFVLPAVFLLGSFSVFGASFLDDEAWTFVDNGMRDPFTFVNVDTTVEPPVEPDKPDIDQILAINIPGAEKAFMQRRFRQVVDICDKGLNSISSLDMPLPVEYVLQAKEQFYQLRRAADLMQRRQAADTAFRNLKFKLRGVVAGERQSNVIINGRVIERGELVSAAGGEKALVEKILPGRVLLRYRGFIMELGIQ